VNRRLLPGTAAALLLWVVTAVALPPGSTPRETELGQEAAFDIERSVLLVDDEETLEKLSGMLAEIAAATSRPDVEYIPHIVASPVVNAFVVPGGWVYVTRGLLDAVQSDDELAGVLGHEIAHNVRQHAIERMRNAPKGLGLLQLASLAAVVLGKSPEAAMLAGAAANAITAAVLNGGSVAAEVDADQEGVGYLLKTRYDPVGFLTFLERMAGSSGKFIEEELGIYRTHPLSKDRVRQARDFLLEKNIPIHRRLVTNPPQPEARSVRSEAGEPRTAVVFTGRTLFLLAGHDEERSAEAVATVSWALDHEVPRGEIRIVPVEGGVRVMAGSGPPLFLSPSDGEANGVTDAVLGGRVRGVLADLVEAEKNRILANYQLY
jgi:Zn-dependent protease with chaperone function